MSNERAEPETAEDLLGELRALLAEGVVKLGLNFKRLGEMDSPVGAESDSMRWVLATLAASMIAFFIGRWAATAIVFVSACALYATVGRRWVRRRIVQRVEETALNNMAVWQKLWRFGGITLTAKRDDLPACVAPAGNWAVLVRSLRDARRPGAPSRRDQT